MNTKTIISLFMLAIAPFALAQDAKPEGKPEGKPGKPCGAEHKHGPNLEKIGEKAGLDEATIAKVKAAHEAVAKDPEVVKARAAVKAAHEKAKADKSEENKAAVKAAMDAAKATHKAAMLKADPSIADALAKIEDARPAAGKDCKVACDGEKGEKGKGKGKGPKGPKKPEAPAPQS